MQKKSTTTIQVNTVKIAFSKKKMTAYGGLSLMAAFFKQIRLREALESAILFREHSPNSTGVYSKIVMYFSMIYAGAERCAHVGYLGNKAVLAAMFGAKRMPDAATSLTRFFNKIKNVTYADMLSERLWFYLSQLILGSNCGRSILLFSYDTVSRREQKKAITQRSMEGRAITPSSPFSTEVNMSFTSGTDQAM
jgi:hypothetical protein